MAENKQHVLEFSKVAHDENNTLRDLPLIYNNIASDLLQDQDKPPRISHDKKDGRDGINVSLPSGVDFRIEQGRIVVNDFGMDKKKLKELLSFCYFYNIENISVPPFEDDEFKELFADADKEVAAEGKSCSFSMTDEAETLPANDNENSAAPEPVRKIKSEGLSEEELLEEKRRLAENIKDQKRVEKEQKAQKAKNKGANLDNIRSYMDGYVKANQKDLTRAYSIRSTSTGWEMLVFKDADQKRDGPQEDKKGHVNPNYEFGIRAELVPGPNGMGLHVQLLTPKMNSGEVFMWEEVLACGKENGFTHCRYEGGMQFKAKFIEACGKKLMVPTGINLKRKEWQLLIDKAKENNDDPEKLKEYYRRLSAEMKQVVKRDHITDPAHPLFKMIKDMDDRGRGVEAAAARQELRFKKFNQFYENNIMGKVVPSSPANEDPHTGLPVVKEESDAVRELAGGMAFVAVLKKYNEDPMFESLSDKEKLDFYKEEYNKQVFLIDKKLGTLMQGLDENKAADLKQRDDILSSHYKKTRAYINQIVTNLEKDYGVNIDNHVIVDMEYIPGRNRQRAALGRRALEQDGMLPTSGRDDRFPVSGRGGRS